MLTAKLMVVWLSVGFLHSPAATFNLLEMKTRALKTTYCLHPQISSGHIRSVHVVSRSNLVFFCPLFLCKFF